MKSTLNNQLAQVCNNLYCLLQDVKKYHRGHLVYDDLDDVIIDLDTQYNTLFKLIYGK